MNPVFTLLLSEGAIVLKIVLIIDAIDERVDAVCAKVVEVVQF
mgnify:CR=1 FL=1